MTANVLFRSGDVCKTEGDYWIVNSTFSRANTTRNAGERRSIHAGDRFPCDPDGTECSWELVMLSNMLDSLEYGHPPQ
jgi:hypothetical protein